MLLVNKYCFPTKVESNTKGYLESYCLAFALVTADENLNLAQLQK